VKRKSPIKHRVKAHIRNGKRVKSFSRGKGSIKLTKKKLTRIELAIQKQAKEMKDVKLTKGAEGFKNWYEGWERNIKGLHPRQKELEDWVEKLMITKAQVKVSSGKMIGIITELERPNSNSQWRATIKWENGTHSSKPIDKIGEVIEADRDISQVKYKKRWNVRVKYFSQKPVVEEGSKL
jgi:hypothetical protein